MTGLPEPEYIPEGEEFEGRSPKARPKWMVPESDLQRRILAAVGRKYFPDRHMKGSLHLVEKSMMPLSWGLMSEYPTEWVENCVGWFEKRNEKGFVPLGGLFTLLQDEDRKNEFIRRYRGDVPRPYNYEQDPYAD